MRRRTVLLFLAVGLALLAGVNIVNRMFGAPPEEARLVKKLKEATDQDLVVIGASTANDIFPEQLCPAASRLDIARDIFDTEAIVDFLIHEGHPPRLVIATAAPNLLYRDSGSRAGYGATRRRELYRAFHTLGYDGLIGNDWRNLAVARLMPALGVSGWRHAAGNVLAKLGHPLIEEKIGEGPQATAMDIRLAGNVAREKFEIRRAQEKRIVYFDGAILDKTSAAIPRIARKLRQSGSTLVILFPPVHQASLQMLEEDGQDVRPRMDKVIDKARKEGAIFIDMFATKGVSEDDRLFSDPEHLNVRGAQLYSEILERELAERFKGEALCSESTAAARISQTTP